MESKDITTELAHRTDSKIDVKKRAIVKFLNYNDMDAVPNQYRQKLFRKGSIYVNEDFSERCNQTL